MQPTSSEIPQRFKEVLEAPLPDVSAMSSTDRIARISLYKEMVNAKIQVPPEHLRLGVDLITIDRAAAAKAARSTSASAKKASAAIDTSKIERMSAEEAADNL